MKWFNNIFKGDENSPALTVVNNESGVNYFSPSFDEICDLKLYSEHLKAVAEEDTLTALRQAAAPSSKAILETAKIIQSKGKLLIELPKNLASGTKFLTDKAGNKLATLVTKNGHFAGHARLAKSSPAIARGAAAAPLILLEAAHLISAHDQMKMLRAMDTKLSRISNHQRNGLRADLEGIYRDSKQLLSSQAELTESNKLTLQGYAKDLMKLRSHWGSNLLDDLKLIKPVKLGLFSKVRTEKARINKRKKLNRATATKAQEHLESLQLMHISLMLQMTLARHTGNIEDFKNITMPDEMKSWQKLSRDCESTITNITLEFPHLLPWKPLLNSIAGFEKVWSPDHEIEQNQLQGE